MLASTGETGVLVHGWWDCKLVQPLWKTVWKFLKKLKIELPYDPVIPLLGIYPKEIKTLTWKNSCTPLFIAALFTIAKTQKQLSVYWWMTGWRKCGIITQWNTIQPLKKKKQGNSTICYNMDGPWGHYMLGEISQTEEDKYNMISLICGV